MNEFCNVWKKYLEKKYKLNTQLPRNFIPDEEKDECGNKSQARQCYEFYEFLREQETNNDKREVKNDRQR